ncbi:winged helix-turn-helix domain-containing protein [Pseudonocardiaceae bacterium YIM PH 21723]|nr:winged helix-turn-helix domain-containing protein [Pseudonocardiaceae bacterium YIM PH 21723]
MALSAQGFGTARPSGTPTRRHLAGVIDRLGLLQLDSVNVAVRAHYMPVFSRMGGYPQQLLDEAAWSHSTRRPRLLVEYWAHEASLLPIGDWPLLKARMRHYAGLLGKHWKVVATEPGLAEDVLSVVKELGPLTAGAIEKELGRDSPRGKGGWWNRSDTKSTCEYLFAVGGLTTGHRVGFERYYDLPERVLPPEVLSAPELSDAEISREFIRRSAVRLGVGTETDLRDYYRLKPEPARTALRELVAAGELEEVTVPGWRKPGYLHPEARRPRKITGRALLCPFDPLVWERDRTERIFDFFYRIEIYTPEHKRVHGYYVYPFLLDERLVARVDLKADRKTGVLRVPGAFVEAAVDPAEHPRVAAELAAELREMADWLELTDVLVGGRGDLADALRQAIG